LSNRAIDGGYVGLSDLDSNGGTNPRKALILRIRKKRMGWEDAQWVGLEGCRPHLPQGAAHTKSAHVQ